MRKAKLTFGYSTRHPRVAAVAWIVDGILRLFVKPRRSERPNGTTRLLVSKIDHLGDLVLLARVMPHLRRLFPEAQIDLLIGSWCRDLAVCMPDVHEIITYDSLFHNRNLPLPSKILGDARSFRAAVRDIRKNRYDIGIDMRAGMVNGIPLMRLGGVKHIIGYATGGFGPLLDVMVPWYPVNEIEKFMAVFHALGPGETVIGNLKLNIPEESRKKAKDLVSKNHAVILHPGCGRSEGWPIESWNTLAKYLSRAGWNIYITGTSSEYRLGEQTTAGIADAVNLCGSMDVKTFLAVVQRADLFIGLDSFSTHVSVSFGVPTILIVNPDTSEEFLPMGEFLLFPFSATARETIDSMEKTPFVASRDGVMSPSGSCPPALAASGDHANTDHPLPPKPF